jgi:hypothetical protein
MSFFAGRFSLGLRSLGFRLFCRRLWLRLLRFLSGLRRWRGRWLRLRFRAGLHRSRRRTRRRGVLRGVLRRSRRCRRLSLLAELRRLCPKENRGDGRSRQCAQSENGGQIHTHVKLDATKHSSGLPPNSSFRCVILALPLSQNSCDFHNPSGASFSSLLPAKYSSGTGPEAGAGGKSCPLPAPTRNQPIRSAIAESDKSAPARFRSLLSWW